MNHTQTFLRIPNEAVFSQGVVKRLREKGYFVQRIESGTTGRGIPDIYCIGSNGQSMWLELKRQRVLEAPAWRPGQRAWMLEASNRGIPCYTLQCLNDRIRVFDMKQNPPALIATWKSWAELKEGI